MRPGEQRRPFRHTDNPDTSSAFCIAVVPPKPENFLGRRHVQDKRAQRASFRVSFMGFSGPRWRTSKRGTLFCCQIAFRGTYENMTGVASSVHPCRALRSPETITHTPSGEPIEQTHRNRFCDFRSNKTLSAWQNWRLRKKTDSGETSFHGRRRIPRCRRKGMSRELAL